MSFANAVKNSSARRQSEFFSPGRYLVRVKDFVEGTTRKGEGFVALETVVVDSSDLELHPAGSERTFFQSTAKDSAAKNIRGLLVNLLDIPDSALTNEMIDRAFSRDPNTGVSVLAGSMLIVHAREIMTKRGSPFTLCDFAYASEDANKLP